MHSATATAVNTKYEMLFWMLPIVRLGYIYVRVAGFFTLFGYIYVRVDILQVVTPHVCTFA